MMVAISATAPIPTTRLSGIGNEMMRAVAAAKHRRGSSSHRQCFYFARRSRPRAAHFRRRLRRVAERLVKDACDVPRQGGAEH